MRLITLVILIQFLFVELTFALDMQPIIDEHDKARDKAEQEYKAKLADVDKKTLSKLNSLARSAKDTDRIEVYKEMLRIDSKNEDAVKYFTALGTLDSVMLSLNNGVERPLEKYVPPKTVQEWKDLKGIEISVDPTKDYTVPASMGLKAGMKIRIVPHPTDQWALTDWDNPTWQAHLQVRIGAGLDKKQLIKLTDLPELLYTVGDYDFQFTNDAYASYRPKMTGMLRIKLILVK